MSRFKIYSLPVITLKAEGTEKKGQKFAGTTKMKDVER